MPDAPHAAVYGFPPFDVVDVPGGAMQVSPLVVGSTDLADLAEGSLDEIVVLAPAGVAERRYVLAQALRALKVEGRLTALAPKDRGGLRMNKELTAFGCTIGESAKRHHRICVALKPANVVGLDAAIAEGAPRRLDGDGLWTQPGVFSWDRLDPGSALLLKSLPPLGGAGVDLGCGIGILAHAVLASPKVTKLTLVDLDRRAVEAARRNVDDPRVEVVQADARRGADIAAGLDFVVTNPPFHETGNEDKGLGQAFITAAAGMLRKGGVLWIVANRHLPYEAVLNAHFKTVRPVADAGGFKVYEARK
ncbi:class I SAM-dependent methyltransferase [Caulobacter sp. UNC279MFTsu5.1]|uniref:class I SAM-dependent methyltransferase n=1 Tax=Caulobacter sp. UNC279MFTsu5.1 TaxID=1502775 RepID=UPI0008EF2897|nr:class I SAM-dependent methyltransferase [Caulobacter sp. UNC279MFTsu5.1]SFJ96186.1 16S rRNA (guanine1207-N2)-methyltransferase [Caulobacter sp. UNC279MFTsu5.1]